MNSFRIRWRLRRWTRGWLRRARGLRGRLALRRRRRPSEQLEFRF